MLTRYFSTTAAGTGDGTSWADRAALFTAGNWSTIITGHNSSTNGGLLALIGPGTYTCSQSLSNALASSINTLNIVVLHGCDSSGNLLEPPDPSWTAARPVWDETNMPVIQTSTNIAAVAAAVGIRLIKFVANGRAGEVLNANLFLDWVIVENQSNDTSARAVILPTRHASNLFLKCSGTSYDYILSMGAINAINIRLEGNPMAAGNAYGLRFTGTTNTSPGVMQQICSFNNSGVGLLDAGSNTNNTGHIAKSIFINNGGSGIQLASTASHASYKRIDNCIIVGNAGYGIDASGQSRTIASNIRAYSNLSGNFGNWLDFPVFSVLDTAEDTMDTFVNPIAGDFRIKNTSIFWGRNLGIEDQPV